MIRDIFVRLFCPSATFALHLMSSLILFITYMNIVNILAIYSCIYQDKHETGEMEKNGRENFCENILNINYN
jgi:hypothetical protein